MPVTEIEIPHSVKNTCFFVYAHRKSPFIEIQPRADSFLIAADKKFRKVQIMPQFLLSFEGPVIKENQRRVKEFGRR
ncbi:UNVERIFIED_CONTAM: hypothetical protein KB574_09640 [Streptococcus canis]|uniref:Uncharacterized protein n=1 Tax=Streptococcus canis TaxID=1329 RepID=A0AAE4TS56_STRCB|nr:hypothetical protein [Streptococcus canis]MDV5977716.1 hypothetical protein [Streptococcus canis]